MHYPRPLPSSRHPPPSPDAPRVVRGGAHHETFLVRAANIESISMNCRPAGLETFGLLGEPVGPKTTSRGRLGRSKA